MSLKHQTGNILVQGGIILDRARSEVIVCGRTHHLTPLECELLATLMQHPDTVLTRAFLMEKVWRTDFTGDTRTLEVHISWLRRKIEKDSSNPRKIQTVRGVGYMFNTTD